MVDDSVPSLGFAWWFSQLEWSYELGEEWEAKCHSCSVISTIDLLHHWRPWLPGKYPTWMLFL